MPESLNIAQKHAPDAAYYDSLEWVYGEGVTAYAREHGLYLCTTTPTDEFYSLFRGVTVCGKPFRAKAVK